MEADEPGMERPAGFARTATATAPSTTKLEPEPLVAAEPSGSTPGPAPSMTAAPTASAAPSAPGTVTQQPAGRVRPLKATKAPSKATSKATKKTSKEAPPADRKWIAPISDDLCPQSHPVKAKLSSRIFHIPGGQNYARCRPDRCYETEQAAQADGFSRSQR
jgi:hypothetical protein